MSSDADEQPANIYRTIFLEAIQKASETIEGITHRLGLQLFQDKVPSKDFKLQHLAFETIRNYRSQYSSKVSNQNTLKWYGKATWKEERELTAIKTPKNLKSKDSMISRFMGKVKDKLLEHEGAKKQLAAKSAAILLAKINKIHFKKETSTNSSQKERVHLHFKVNQSTWDSFLITHDPEDLKKMKFLNCFVDLDSFNMQEADNVPHDETSLACSCTTRQTSPLSV